jgi:hypothetical protein
VSNNRDILPALAVASAVYSAILLLFSLWTATRTYVTTPPDPEFTFMIKHSLPGMLNGNFNKLTFLFAYSIFPFLVMTYNIGVRMNYSKINVDNYLGSYFRNRYTTPALKISDHTDFYKRYPKQTTVYFGCVVSVICTFMLLQQLGVCNAAARAFVAH